MIGATSPLASEPGTIRGDLAIITGKNIMCVFCKILCGFLFTNVPPMYKLQF